MNAYCGICQRTHIPALHTGRNTMTSDLLDIAETLDQLHHRLCDIAEATIPATNDDAAPLVVLPTVDEITDIIREGGFYSDTARAILALFDRPVDPALAVVAMWLEEDDRAPAAIDRMADLLARIDAARADA